MDSFLEELGRQGPFVVGALALVGAFIKGWIHTGREFDAMVEDRNLWRDEARELLKTNRRATRVADVASKPKRQNRKR